jgi:hypothetical protein
MAYVIVHFYQAVRRSSTRRQSRRCIPPEITCRRDTSSARQAPPGGWTIVAVHDSKESWERFRDGTLMPRMKRGVKGGFTQPPQETAFESYNLKP